MNRRYCAGKHFVIYVMCNGRIAMIDDNPAISVLMIRTMRELHLRDIEQNVISQANQRLAQHVAQLTNLKAAFAVFGFDAASKDVWRQIREKIGAEAYREALDAGQDAVASTVTTISTKTGSGWVYTTTTTHEREQVSQPEKASQYGGPSSTKSEAAEEADPQAASEEIGVDQADGETADAATAPRVRDAILERLKFAGPRGLRASELRQYYENAFATILHEKTIGMTLYRLSKEERVRREGRTWFYVPPDGEVQNPNIEAPQMSKELRDRSAK